MAAKKKRRKNKSAAGKKGNGKQKKLYKDFHASDPKNARQENFNIEKGLVRLGECDIIPYISDKWGEKGEKYEHRFKKPYPALYANTDGNILIIKGKFKIEDVGIVG